MCSVSMNMKTYVISCCASLRTWLIHGSTPGNDPTNYLIRKGARSVIRRAELHLWSTHCAQWLGGTTFSLSEDTGWSTAGFWDQSTRPSQKASRRSPHQWRRSSCSWRRSIQPEAEDGHEVKSHSTTARFCLIAGRAPPSQQILLIPSYTQQTLQSYVAELRVGRWVPVSVTSADRCVWYGWLPSGSWSCWSASSRYWSEGQTLQPWSGHWLGYLLQVCRLAHPAPPRQSSDEPTHISSNTINLWQSSRKGRCVRQPCDRLQAVLALQEK